MSWYERLSRSMRRLLTMQMGELTRGQRLLRYAIDLVRHCHHELHKDRAGQTAAALTYHTLFSLLPTVVLSLVVLASFPGLEDARENFQQSLIDRLLPPRVETDSLRAETPLPGTTEAPAEQDLDPTARYEQARAQHAEWIGRYMSKLEDVDFRSIGVVGLLVFIYGATALLAAIERSFNLIVGVSRARPWYLRLPLYYTVITLGPLVLIAGQLFQKRFFSSLIESGAWTNWLAGPMFVLSPVLTTWLTLFIMFVLLPNTRVNRRAAAVGSLVSAMAWVIWQELFGVFVAHAAITTVYGALALLPLFLLWLWLTWLIILFGLELTYTLQTLRGKQIREEQARRESRVVGDPLWLVPLMARIGRAFVEGRTIHGAELADALHLPARSIEQLGERLEAEGLVHQIQRDGRDCSGYSLALPPDRIPITRLLKLGRSLTMGSRPSRDDPAWAILERLAQAQQDAAGGMSLQSLLEEGAESDEASPTESEQAPRRRGGTNDE